MCVDCLHVCAAATDMCLQLVAAFEQSLNFCVLHAATAYLDLWLDHGGSTECLSAICFYFAMVVYNDTQPCVKQLADYISVDKDLFDMKCHEFLVGLKFNLFVNDGHLLLLKDVTSPSFEFYLACVTSVLYFPTGTFKPSVFHAAITGVASHEDATQFEQCKKEFASALDDVKTHVAMVPFMPEIELRKLLKPRAPFSTLGSKQPSPPSLPTVISTSSSRPS